MTNDDVLKVVHFYREHLTKLVLVERAKRWTDHLDANDNILVPSKGEQFEHLRWMADEMLQKIASGEMREGKAFRWLGFFQGVLWSHGLFALPDLREHNRSIEGE